MWKNIDFKRMWNYSNKVFQPGLKWLNFTILKTLISPILSTLSTQEVGCFFVFLVYLKSLPYFTLTDHVQSTNSTWMPSEWTKTNVTVSLSTTNVNPRWAIAESNWRNLPCYEFLRSTVEISKLRFPRNRWKYTTVQVLMSVHLSLLLLNEVENRDKAV